MSFKKYILAFCLSWLALSINAQIVIDDTQTVEWNVLNKIAGPGVAISNIMFNSQPVTDVNPQIGNFNSLNANVGLETGVILSNGNINSVIGPNDEDHYFLPTSAPAPTDPDLLQLSSPQPAFDAAVLEFTFIPNGDTVEFDFVFASEEYPEGVGSAYNDVFGFFVAGPGITGPFSSPTLPPFNFPDGAMNVALIPGTTTPVSINNVNAVTNSSYFIGNGDGNSAPFNADPQYIQADGFTTPITVKFAVQCGEQYYIKFAVGDVFDSQVDSYVFIEEDSFSTITPTEVFVADGDDALLEGCDSVTLEFVRYNDLSNPAVVDLTVSGTGTNGVDYTNIPSQLNFPIGQNTVSLTVHALADALTEGIETLNIHVANYGSTFCGNPIESDVNITLHDNVVGIMSGGGTVCPGGSADVQIDFSGNAPWDIEYTVNSVLVSETVTTNPYIITSSFQEEYILTDVSSGGCSGLASGSATINAPAVPTLNISGSTDFCSGECRDVTFTMTGTPPFSIKYSIDGTEQTELVTNNFSETINLCNDAVILPISIYSYGISDCNGTISGSATLNEYELPTLSVPGTVGICSGNMADIPLTLSNGNTWTIEYTYNGVAQTPITGVVNGQIFQQEDPGNYTFTQVTSETPPFCSNVINQTTVVDNFIAPIATMENMDTTICIGASIDIPVTFSGAAPWTFEYTLDGVSQGSFMSHNDTILTVNQNGNYEIYSISDALCSGIHEGVVDLNIASPIANPITNILGSCNGESVLLESMPTGGIDEDFTFVWQEGSATISNVSTATVTPILTDASTEENFNYLLTISQQTCGIDYIFPYFIETHPIPNSTFTNTDITLCLGESIDLEFTNNGTGSFTVDYSLDNVPQTSVVTNLETFNLTTNEPGEYTINSITDDYCFNDNISSSFIFDQYIQPEAVIDTGDSTVCLGTSIDVPVSFIGTAPFTFDYIIDGVLSETITTNNNPHLLNISGIGEHSIGNISDANCSSIGIGSCTLDFFETISMTLAEETISCAGDELLVEPTSISGGDPSSFNFEWLSDAVVVSNDPVLIFNPTSSGVIELRITDFCDIEFSASSNLIVEDYPEIIVEVMDDEVCPGELVDFNNNSILSTMDNQFTWDFGDNKQAFTEEVIHGYENPGYYDLGLTITTPNGCVSTMVYEDMILVNIEPNPNFISTPEIGNMSEPEIEFYNQSSGDIIAFEWNFGDGGSSDEENPIYTYPEDRAATYLACLAVENIHGCVNDICRSIEIEPIYNMFLPSAFTPDGDGLNESFGPVLHTSDIDTYEFVIYDRDGHPVFQSNDPESKWNGSYLTNPGYYVNNGIYSWQMRVKLKNHSDVKVHQGNVTVIR